VRGKALETFLTVRRPAPSFRAENARGEHQPLPHQRRVGRKKPGESSVMESVQPIYRAIHRKHYRPRRRRLDQPAEGQQLYACPLYTPAGTATVDAPHLAEFLAPVKPTLASDKTGMLASFLVTVGRFLLHLDGPPGRRQFFFRDVTEADVSDFLNGKSGCNPLKLLSSMASLVEQPPFAQGRYATSISGRATSLVPPPHRGMRPGLARPRSTGTDIPQQDNLDLPPKTRIHSRRTFPRQRREAWKPRR